MSQQSSKVRVPGAHLGVWSEFTASVRMSRGVVGNTSFAFMVTAIAAVALAIAFIATSHPLLAFGGLALPFLAFFCFLTMTWHNVAKHPDPAVAGDADYAQVVEARQGAAQTAIVVDATPVVAGRDVSRLIPGGPGGDRGK